MINPTRSRGPAWLSRKSRRSSRIICQRGRSNTAAIDDEDHDAVVGIEASSRPSRAREHRPAGVVRLAEGDELGRRDRLAACRPRNLSHRQLAAEDQATDMVNHGARNSTGSVSLYTLNNDNPAVTTGALRRAKSAIKWSRPKATDYFAVPDSSPHDQMLSASSPTASATSDKPMTRYDGV